MKHKKEHKKARKLMWFLGGLTLTVALVVGITNAITINVGGSKIVSASEAKNNEPQCILVLGASVLPNGRPSGILQDRLDVAIDLYHSGVASKIIMSGDHGTESYNEVLSMKEYAIEQGVPSEDIFSDHAGFSTYESMYRAKNIFQVERMVVVTQTYHLYRALFAANGLGMDAVGVSSDLRAYANQPFFDLREIPARVKDYFQTVLKLPNAFEGEVISLDQSGSVTADDAETDRLSEK